MPEREGVPTLTPAERAARIQAALEAPAPPLNRAQRRAAAVANRSAQRRRERSLIRLSKEMPR